MKKLIIAAALLGTATTAFAKWETKTVTDPMTDVNRGIAHTIFEEGKPAIIIKCDKNGSGSLYVQIVSNEFLGKGRYGIRDVKYRFDGGAPATVSAFHDGRDAIIFDLTEKDAKAFVTGLASSNEMVLQLTSYDGDMYTNVMDVSGGGAAIKEAATTCGDTNWSTI